MAKLPILHYPDPRLRNTGQPVEQVDDTIRRLIDDMFETMYAAPGIGLAAIQVNVPKRIIIMDVSDTKTTPYCFINPRILSCEGEFEMEEGCLSLPGVYETVKRPDRVRVRALDRSGESFEMEACGLLSVCIQHEVDHLEGKLFVDYLSRLKRQRIRKKAGRQHKLAL